MNILCWNARGLGPNKKRNSLHNIRKDYQIDIIAVQETKKEEFSKRILDSIWIGFDTWITKPAVGSSGGILLGLDSSNFIVEKFVVQTFSVSV